MELSPPNANSCWPIAWPCSTAAWCTTPNRRCPPNTSSVLPKAWPDRFQKTCYASGAPVSAGASAMTWKSTTTATATRSLSANCSIRTATATTTSGAGSNTSASWRRKPRQKKAATGTASWPTCRSGGFEYLERLYVCVEPGPEHGAVIAWSHGLAAGPGRTPAPGFADAPGRRCRRAVPPVVLRTGSVRCRGTPAAWPTSYWKRWTPWRPLGSPARR